MGFPHGCLVPGPELSLIDEQGRDAAGKVIPISMTIVFSLNSVAEGELVIKSHYHRQRLSLGRVVLRFDKSTFTISSGGAVTL